jgi:hydrogenase maturation protease
MTRENPKTPPRVCVIGIGNDYRNDDAVGLKAAREIRERNAPGVRVAEFNGDGCELANAWNCDDVVYLIDAVCSGAKIGTIHRIDALRQIIPPGFIHQSTHALGIQESLELSRVVGTLPLQCILYGIEGDDFGLGTTISPGLKESVESVVDKIVKEIQAVPDRSVMAGEGQQEHR